MQATVRTVDWYKLVGPLKWCNAQFIHSQRGFWLSTLSRQVRTHLEVKNHEISRSITARVDSGIDVLRSRKEMCGAPRLLGIVLCRRAIRHVILQRQKSTREQALSGYAPSAR